MQMSCFLVDGILSFIHALLSDFWVCLFFISRLYDLFIKFFFFLHFVAGDKGKVVDRQGVCEACKQPIR